MSNKKSLLGLSLLLLFSCGGNTYQKDPFFTGKEYLMVCKRPYSESSDCQSLYVRNNNGMSMTVFLTNGSPVRLDDMYCTDTIFDEPICQGVDTKGNTWDILKIGSTI